MAQDERNRDDRGSYQAQGAGGMGNIPLGGSYVGGGGQYDQGDYSRGGDTSGGGTGHHSSPSGGFGGGLPGGYGDRNQSSARYGGAGAADTSSAQHSGAMTIGGYGGMVGSSSGLRNDARYGGGRSDRGGHGLYGGDIGRGDFGRDQMSGFGGQHTSYGSGSDVGHYDQFGQRQATSEEGQPPYRDEHYHALRQRHLEQCDRDYEEFRRERQERFNAEFEAWRAGRR